MKKIILVLLLINSLFAGNTDDLIALMKKDNKTVAEYSTKGNVVTIKFSMFDRKITDKEYRLFERNIYKKYGDNALAKMQDELCTDMLVDVASRDNYVDYLQQGITMVHIFTIGEITTIKCKQDYNAVKALWRKEK